MKNHFLLEKELVLRKKMLLGEFFYFLPRNGKIKAVKTEKNEKRKGKGNRGRSKCVYKKK
ncbi:MAG: hypothetical protein KAT65_01245 [Methanophagales archaeon]|jgi:hypothetical protein|nr:hypothetical protein [Methanophagales archaeon]